MQGTILVQVPLYRPYVLLDILVQPLQKGCHAQPAILLQQVEHLVLPALRALILVQPALNVLPIPSDTILVLYQQFRQSVQQAPIVPSVLLRLFLAQMDIMAPVQGSMEAPVVAHAPQAHIVRLVSQRL